MQIAQQRIHAPNGDVSAIILPLLSSLNKDRHKRVSSKPYKTYYQYFMGETDTRNCHNSGRRTHLSWILILHIAKYNIIYSVHPPASPKVEAPLISSPFYWLQCTVAHGNTHRQGWRCSKATTWHTAEALTMSTINQVTVCNCLHLFLLSFSIFAIVGQNSETAD